MDYEKYEKLRDLKGLKNSDVARIANIPASTFTDWKKGKSTPKAEKIKKIADALGTTPSYFMGWQDMTENETGLINDLYGAASEGKKWTWLDDNEQDIINSYRNFDDETKRQLVLMLAFLKNQNKDK